MKRIWIPTLISVGNIISGFVAIVYVFNGDLPKTMWWMVAAVLFDAFDGVVASRLNAKSEMGAQVDAFSDIVSFAMLPGFALFQFFQSAPSSGILLPIVAWVAGVGYAVAGIFRELRFLSLPPDQQSRKGFTGLPIAPPASLLVALIVLSNLKSDVLPLPWMLILVFILAMLGAYMMTISRMEYLRWKRGILFQALGASVFGIWGYVAIGNIHGAGAAFFVAFSAIYFFAHPVHQQIGRAHV